VKHRKESNLAAPMSKDPHVQAQFCDVMRAAPE